MADASRDFRDLVVKRRDACVNYTDDKPSKDRKRALRFYRGENLPDYGDSGDGLSTVVSRDVMEAIESIMPPLVRPFVAGEEVVSYEPRGPEDEDGAKQAADYDNFVFTTHNNAFRVIYNSLKDGLMYRLGVAKTVMEEVQDGAPERYDGLTEEQVDQLRLAMPDRIIDPIEQNTGDEADPTLFTFNVTLAPKKVKRYRVHIIAPEEFLYEERLASLDQATFLGHTKQVLLADLIDMGIDEKKAKALKSGRPETSDEADQRHDHEDETEYDDDDLSRPIWVDECYIRTYVGGGSPCLEWRKVVIGGSQGKLLNGARGEPIDNHPFSTWTPIPIPHKLVGMSYTDVTEDIQINKTAVQRESNNALYLANRPMREVLDGQVNIDDLLNPSVGGIVRVKQMGAIAPMASGGDVAFGASAQMIEYWDTVRESRTGVTRYNQGMDSQSLNKTATGMNIIASASQQRQELVARQYAEFLKDVFGKIRALASLHATKGEVMRLRGQWVEVDPSEWKNSYDMTVSVGLGSNNKDQLVGQLQSLLETQARIIEFQGSADGPLVTMENVYHVLKKQQEAMGLKGDKYFTDPAEQQQQPAQPAQPEQQPQDPAQTEIAKEQIKAESRENVAQIKGQFDLAKQAANTGFLDPSMAL